jgi:hypothetical protein
MRALALLCTLALVSPALASGVDVVDTPIHVAVRDLEVTGFDARKAKIATDALLVELRKLERVSVISMEEIRELLEMEAEKQSLGCEEASCLSEIADALGADVLLIGSIAVVGDETVFGLKRLDQQAAKVVAQVTRRLEPLEGEEVLAAIGPAVQELFPERALKPGKERGVEEKVALSLNPPPLSPAWAIGGGATAGVLGALGALTGVANVGLRGALDRKLARRGSASAPSQAEIDEQASLVNATATGAWVLIGTAAALGAGAGVASLFTDWRGDREAFAE